MITTKLKDNILIVICSCELQYERVYTIDKQALLKEISEECSENELTSILSQFARMGLISHYVNNSNTIRICLLVEASDFLSRGGFYAQEELLKANIEKLSAEIDLLAKKLQPDFLEEANRLAALGASIVSVLAFLKS